MTRIRLTTAVGLAGSLFGYSLSAAGAGFALIEQSVSGLGNAFAGGAALSCLCSAAAGAHGPRNRGHAGALQKRAAVKTFTV